MRLRALAGLVGLVVALAGCGGERGRREITVYSGRSEKLVGPLIARFETRSGLRVKVRYGDSAELASQILEEGAKSPADVFFSQDAGALGALQAEGRFAPLPADVLERVPERFRSGQGRWVGTSGRVRVIAYNPTLVEPFDLPASVQGLTAARWKDKVGWAPTNGSFQAFVTAFRQKHGRRAAKVWLEAMKRNGARSYPGNDEIAEAIADGEIPVGLVNHYYPFEVREERPGAKVEAQFLKGGDVGGLVNVAGCGILEGSERAADAARFVGFLLSAEGQRYFVSETWEYPLVAGIEPFEGLPSLATLEAPAIDLSSLADLEGTLDLLKEVGLV